MTNELKNSGTKALSKRAALQLARRQKFLEDELRKYEELKPLIDRYVSHGLSEKSARHLVYNEMPRREKLLNELLLIFNLPATTDGIRMFHEILTWLAEQMEPAMK